MDAGVGDGSPVNDGPRNKKLRTSDAPRPMCTNCEQCQLRKGKCDGNRPVCGWCAANNKQCIYQEKKKPGLKAGYGRDLEKRLTNLEENVSSREDELERKVLVLEEQLESHSKLLDSLRSARITKRPPNHVSPPPAGQPGMGMVTGSSPPPGSLPQSYGPVGANVFPNFSSPSTSSGPSTGHGDGVLPHRSSVTSHMQMNGLPAAQRRIGPMAQSSNSLADPDLPPIEFLYPLLEIFFDRINSWFPLLDRKSTVNRVLRDQTEEDMILLHAIVATTIRWYDKSTAGVAWRAEYEARKGEWHGKSKQKVIFHSFETPSIRRLQALAIVALDMIGEQNGGPGMFILASIARCATQLGLISETFSLTTSPDYPTISTLRATVLPDAKDWIEDESRRRLFWCIYMLDRDTTVATAFDFVVDEATIDRKLPCKEELFSQNRQVETRWFETKIRRSDHSIDRPENLGEFAYLIELKGLMTTIHQFLKKSVNINARSEVESWRQTYREIDNTLRTWRANLPVEFRNAEQVLASIDTVPMSTMWILLQITYYTTFIRLHSSAAYPPHKTPIFKPSASAAQQCFHAVQMIVALTRYVVGHELVNSQGFPFAFALWVAARVLLVHGSTIERQVSGDIHLLIQVLQQVGEFWPVAARYAQVLQRVMNEYTDSQATMAAAAATGSVAPQPPSVTILSDMRRCAYDLDMLISNEPLRQSSSILMSGWHGPQAKPTDNQPPMIELDYLETFNFFNYPRMPMQAPIPGAAGGAAQPDGTFNAYYSPSDGNSQASLNGFNVGDISSDWLSTHFS